MEFFNKYANQHDVRTATAAFCAMRKGLDASDLNSFPESIYGKADMKNLDRYLKIAQKYKDFGAIQGDPEKAAGIIHLKLGDATESDSVSQSRSTSIAS